MLVRWIRLTMPVLLLAGCSSQPVYAPVGTRDHVQQSAPAETTAAKSAPAGTTAAVSMPARTYKAPAGRRPVARSSSGYHVVQRGETLYSIAWKYGLSFRELAAMNRIHSPYTIYAGQRLRTTSYNRQSASAGTDSRPAPARTAVTPAPAPGSVATAKPAPAPQPAANAQTAPDTTSSTAASPETQAVVTEDKPLPDAVDKWVWPTKGQLLHGYQPDNTGKKGIDIGGRSGQTVMAAADGKVVYAGSGLVGYGRLIIIKHTDSLLSAYGHNSELLVKEGQHVRAGQTIARMGNSGTDRTQLYFEIRKDGKPVNPLRYLPEA
jgi:lipoprotein NlpD